jgi:hypothetical protein
VTVLEALPAAGPALLGRVEPGASPRFRLRPRDEDEARLVAAAERGRARAVARTRARLGGFAVDELSGQADENRMAVLRVDRDFVGSLDAARVVDHALVHDDLTHPRLRLADGTGRDLNNIGEGVQRAALAPTDIAQGRPFPLYDAMTRGRTVVLNHLAPRTGGPLVDFVNDLARVTTTSAQVNVYLSEREAPGFGRHWDDHDVLILQCRGRKFWEVYAPAHLSALVNYTDKQAFGASVWSGVLEPGLGLYIPRGWGHRVVGIEGEVSLHYTVGMRRMTLVDLIGWRADAGTGDLASLWVDPARPPELTAAELDDAEVEHLVGRWRSRLIPTVAHGPVEVARAAADGFAGTRWFAAVPGGAVLVDHDRRDPEHLGFAAADAVFAVHRSLTGFLARLLDGEPVGFEDLVGLVPGRNTGTAVAALFELASRDLVQLCPR